VSEQRQAEKRVVVTKSQEKRAKTPTTKLRLDAHQIILRPLVTEKGIHRAETNNQYSFEVNPLANKIQIRKAIEYLFDVKVVKVRTQNRKGKPRRYRLKYGMTKNWKKALVTLDQEYRIDFF
jgi:large subunit ribosomal protein L23